jgi:hypothetical protein
LCGSGDGEKERKRKESRFHGCTLNSECWP